MNMMTENEKTSCLKFGVDEVVVDSIALPASNDYLPSYYG